MKIKCIIIDDEPLAIKVVENHLNEFQNFEILGKFDNPLEALPLLKKGGIDVLFLDINMPQMNGLDFAKIVGDETNVVITTAYREYAVESYDLNVLDYLVKPIPFNRFLNTVNKITQQAYGQKDEGEKKEDSVKNDSFMFMKVGKKLVKIQFEDILYIESLKDYIKIFTKGGNHLVHKSLTSVTEELPKDNFIRIHRSFTIAIDKVASVEGNLIEIGSARIPIGRKYTSHVKRMILNID
ncbi:MAG: response regulator transcription factor [Flavobacteriaceae bacterium]